MDGWEGAKAGLRIACSNQKQKERLNEWKKEWKNKTEKINKERRKSKNIGKKEIGKKER